MSKCGSPECIDIKKEELKEELKKPKEEQNKRKIIRLQESIKRNKNIAYQRSRYRRFKKIRNAKRK